MPALVFLLYSSGRKVEDFLRGKGIFFVEGGVEAYCCQGLQPSREHGGRVDMVRQSRDWKQKEKEQNRAGLTK